MLKTYLKALLLFILLTVLVACGGNGADDTPVATVESATDTPAPTETAAPTEEPTTAPTETTAPEPAVEPALEPTTAPVAAPERLGLLRFSDHEGARSGAFRLQMNNVPPAPAGNHYELWLVSDEGSNLNLGEIPLAEGSVDYSGQTDENLLGTYNRGLISVQPDGETSSAPDVVAFYAQISPESLLHVRHVVFEFSYNPDSQGFILGAEAQNGLAIEHAGFMQEALAAGDLEEAKQHAEHVVNILDGEEGTFFGDYTGDEVAQNPGDGLGVRYYLAGAAQHARLAAEAQGATAEVMLHSEHVVIASNNALTWMVEAIEEAIRLISTDSVEEAQPVADTLSQLLSDIQTGRDEDGDGAVAPVAGEGAIATAYEHGQFMGGFEVFAAEDAPAGNSPSPVVEEPEPTEAPPAEPEEVIIDMVNFAYSELELTIPAGTVVTWVNMDEVQHSATADDGSFDTGLFDGDEQASVTFDTAGTFPYYCLLHGQPGGQGMSATITVTEE